MKQCQNCGQTLPDTAQFCSNCGSASFGAALPPVMSYPQMPPPPVQMPQSPPVPRRGGAGLAGVLFSLMLFLGVTGFVVWRLGVFEPLNEVVGQMTGKADIDHSDTGKRDQDADDGDALDDDAGTPGGFALPDGVDVENAEENGSGEWDDDTEYTTENPYIDTAVDREELDEGLEKIEEAFSSADLETVQTLLLPAVQESMMHAFTANEGRLPEVAELLKTRKPVFISEAYAEYEVTDNGKIYIAIFQRTSAGWVLVSL